MVEILAIAITFKPEISISDIAAIAALISSALIFYFGYSQTRKSEQIKIARAVMDRVEEKIEKLNEIKKLSETQTGEEGLLRATHSLIKEIEYFSSLSNFSNEIRDWNIIQSCIPTLGDGVMAAKKCLSYLLKPETADPDPVVAEIALLEMVKETMKHWFEKYMKGTGLEEDYWEWREKNPKFLF